MSWLLGEWSLNLFLSCYNSQFAFGKSYFSTLFPLRDRLDCGSSCYPVGLSDVDITVRITRNAIWLEIQQLCKASTGLDHWGWDATQNKTVFTAMIDFQWYSDAIQSPSQYQEALSLHDRGWLSTISVPYKLFKFNVFQINWISMCMKRRSESCLK